MTETELRKKVREILRDRSRLKVTGARKTGIDHKDGFVISLSDGRKDYAPLQGFSLTGESPGMYGCKMITGILNGRLDGGAYQYEFRGIDCEEYVEVDVDSIRLADHIS